MEAVRSSETSINLYHSTRDHIPALVTVFFLLVRLSFRPDDGSRMFLRNAGELLPDYTASHPRTQYAYSPNPALLTSGIIPLYAAGCVVCGSKSVGERGVTP
jgi:hypothetical protein